MSKYISMKFAQSWKICSLQWDSNCTLFPLPTLIWWNSSELYHSILSDWNNASLPSFDQFNKLAKLGDMSIPMISINGKRPHHTFSGIFFATFPNEHKRIAARVLCRPFNILKVYASQLYVILLQKQNKCFSVFETLLQFGFLAILIYRVFFSSLVPPL